MRNLSILLCIILCLNACKKSTDRLPITPASLAGDWIRQSVTTMTYTNGKLTHTSDTTYNTTGNSFSNLNIGYYFSVNLSGTFLQPGINGIPFTYIISGDQLNLDFGNVTDLSSYFTIKSVTNTQLDLIEGTTSGTERYMKPFTSKKIWFIDYHVHLILKTCARLQLQVLGIFIRSQPYLHHRLPDFLILGY